MGVAQQLAFIRAGMETKRYHVVPTLGANTVAHHSFGVAMLVHVLCDNSRADEHVLTLAALSHDLAEHQVGDLPADAKRRLSDDARQQFDGLENVVLIREGLFFVLNDEQRRILKFADCADGALFCCRERAMGNKLVTPTFENYRRYLREFQPYGEIERGVVYFIDEEWSKANG